MMINNNDKAPIEDVYNFIYKALFLNLENLYF